ncbi:hypothetical protein AUEXF2481DRAFT_36860 [Aureobasidium subglaciale EXF-2481]|uniref:Uncharacterized protein n=1 Tax=Aureobasidium subglaciale (strain EXF-2481) TaxID=1043005 RepID=A0A074YW09_AURSE|nr:uncharacterized protein AUEXF2481DRAFT_36860 [Aureobasidium subglaciale EXF-2481]KEQ98347.1 hypothetical protein AUEXF2481DRAFT_36860 [Aureobasidium subglaciale EXF-2481]
MRFPLPYNIGEYFAPGTIDEKLRCEAATYVWLNKHCPTIPLPRLLGMGFPGSQSVGSRGHLADLRPLTVSCSVYCHRKRDLAEPNSLALP